MLTHSLHHDTHTFYPKKLIYSTHYYLMVAKFVGTLPPARRRCYRSSSSTSTYYSHLQTADLQPNQISDKVCGKYCTHFTAFISRDQTINTRFQVSFIFQMLQDLRPGGTILDCPNRMSSSTLKHIFEPHCCLHSLFYTLTIYSNG